MNEYLVLVVEDDKPIRNLITTTLKMNDYRFITCLLYTSDAADE